MFRAKGISRVLEHIIEALCFDISRGLDTNTREVRENYPKHLLDKNEIVPYQPSHTSTINRALSFLKDEISINFRKFSFTDLGCGKGKVLIVAQDFQFSFVKGVEINPTLCNICEQNLLKTKAKKTKLFKMDAAEFNEYQSQEIVYCFNSFGLKTIEKVEKKLRRNKDVYFIYCNPVHSSIFDGWNLVWTDNNKNAFRNTKIFHISN